MKVLVTGSGGLIGSESVRFFSGKGAEVIGIDNNKLLNYSISGEITICI